MSNPTYKLSIKSTTVTFKHICVMPALYDLMHFWIVENDWTPLYGGTEGSLETMFYTNRTNPTRWNYNIWWRVQKEINKYVRYVMNIDFIGLGVSQVEAVWKGKKYKAYKGEFTFNLSAWVEVDPNGEWKESKIVTTFSNYLVKTLLRKNMLDYRDDLRRQLLEFQGFIKNFFGQYQNIQASESMEPKRGFGFS